MRSVTTVAALLLLAIASTVRAGDVQPITSPEHSNVVLDRALLRALFTMRVRQWPDGVAARVFVMPDASDLHDRFCRQMLGTYPYVLRNTWDRAVFTGTGFAPEVVNSEAEMRERVRQTRGAIGYVSTDRAPMPSLSVTNGGNKRGEPQ